MLLNSSDDEYDMNLISLMPQPPEQFDFKPETKQERILKKIQKKSLLHFKIKDQLSFNPKLNSHFTTAIT